MLGRGEEERRISAPNSICWRTWPAPRQAENSTYVRTSRQCWLCPHRALPSCCAPPSIPALCLLPPDSAPPHGDQPSGRGVLGSLELPYFSDAQTQSWSLLLSPSAAFHMHHQVCPAAASPQLSSGAGEAERSSRRELSFIRSRHLAPAPPAATGPGSGSGWGHGHTQVPRQLQRQVGNLHESPIFPQV